MIMKKILALIATSSLIFGNGVISQLFSHQQSKTPVPNLIEQKVATVNGPQFLQSGAVLPFNSQWTLLTTFNRVYLGDNTVVPGVKPAANFFPYGQTIVGYARSNVSPWIVVQEVQPNGFEFSIYSIDVITKALIKKEILFAPGIVSKVTAVGMINMVDGTPYIIVAGKSLTNPNDTILAGYAIISGGTRPVFPKNTFIVPNTQFQQFSRFFEDIGSPVTNRQKMYYTSNRYNSETGNWDYGHIGVLTFGVKLDYSEYTFNPNNDNKVYSDNPTGSKDLRFASYYDERLLAWDNERPSNKVYWVDTAAVIGVNFGQTTAPGTVNFIYNKDGDRQEFTIYSSILELSAGYEFQWNQKMVNPITLQIFLRKYNEIFGGQTRGVPPFVTTFSTYGLYFNEANFTTEIWRFTGL